MPTQHVRTFRHFKQTCSVHLPHSRFQIEACPFVLDPYHQSAASGLRLHGDFSYVRMAGDGRQRFLHYLEGCGLDASVLPG